MQWIELEFNSIQFNSIDGEFLASKQTMRENKKKRSHEISISKFNWIISVNSQFSTFNYTIRIRIEEALTSGHQSPVCCILYYIWKISENKQANRNESINQYVSEWRNVCLNVNYVTYDSDHLWCNSWSFDFYTTKQWSMSKLWWLEQ